MNAADIDGRAVMCARGRYCGRHGVASGSIINGETGEFVLVKFERCAGIGLIDSRQRVREDLVRVDDLTIFDRRAILLEIVNKARGKLLGAAKREVARLHRVNQWVA